MTIKHALYEWKFDTEELALAMKDMSIEDVHALADMLDLSPTTIARWRSGTHHPDAPYPNMTNFLKLCNALELNPLNMFKLEKQNV